MISACLTKMKIHFLQQHTFTDCVNPKTKTKLRFDFYLPDFNICIEYDGKQHYQYDNYGWNTEEHYYSVVYRDSIKNDYCNQKGILLIRIPYTDFEKIDIDYLREKIYTSIGVSSQEKEGE